MSAALKGSVAAGCATRCDGASVMRRKAFSGQAVTMALPKRSPGRRGALLVRAFDDDDEEPREWPYPKFIQGKGLMEQLLYMALSSLAELHCCQLVKSAPHG